mmetsp:Transcript_109196/g.348573  ORF Transcript_109196/g.348573 Transcript_109196/m.348573 type:complete len:135 (+) Transcript_109196:475-879(+)
MSVGCPGMSKETCIERAIEVQKDTSQCPFFSYSSSSQPQQQSQFCLCFKECSELTNPSAEVWETVNPEEAKRSITVVAFAIAAAVGIVVTTVFVCCILRHRRIRAATSLRDTTGNCVVHESAVPDPETNRNAEV